ncbi:hypothetical protein GY663_31220, partial [Klebsiella michiganensis]|nr:hypothetical protein [Klebsiella michiganensis]
GFLGFRGSRCGDLCIDRAACAVQCSSTGHALSQQCHLADPAHAAPAPAAEVETAFVQVDKLLAPLVSPDEGRLTGYVQFQFNLEV